MVGVILETLDGVVDRYRGSGAHVAVDKVDVVARPAAGSRLTALGDSLAPCRGVTHVPPLRSSHPVPDPGKR